MAAGAAAAACVRVAAAVPGPTHPPARPATPADIPDQEIRREERRRDPQPDPGQADRRGALRGAQAEPRRGLQDDRLAGHRPRLPQGQGARRGSSTSGSAAAPCCEEAVNEALPQLLRAGRRGERGPPARPARGRRDRGARPERRRRPEVHRRGRRPARDRPARPRRRSRSPSTTSRSPTADVDERLQHLRERFGTLAPVERPAAERRLRRRSTSRPRSTARRSTPSPGISYEVGTRQHARRPRRGPRRDDRRARPRTFTAPLAGGEHAGEDADVTVTVQSVKERELPELDDDFAQLASEFDTLEELRADLRHAGRDGASGSSRACRPATRLLRAAAGLGRDPVPDGAGRGRGRPATSRPRHGSRTTSTAPRSRRRPARRCAAQLAARRDRRGRGGRRSASSELIEYLVVQRPAVRHGPQRVRQGRRPRPARSRRWSPRWRGARRWPLCCPGPWSPTPPATRSTSTLSVPAVGGRPGRGPPTSSRASDPASDLAARGSAAPPAPAPAAPDRARRGRTRPRCRCSICRARPRPPSRVPRRARRGAERGRAQGAPSSEQRSVTGRSAPGGGVSVVAPTRRPCTRHRAAR